MNRVPLPARLNLRTDAPVGVGRDDHDRVTGNPEEPDEDGRKASDSTRAGARRLDRLAAEIEQVGDDEEFTALARSMLERNKEILDRLAE